MNFWKRTERACLIWIVTFCRQSRHLACVQWVNRYRCNFYKIIDSEDLQDVRNYSMFILSTILIFFTWYIRKILKRRRICNQPALRSYKNRKAIKVLSDKLMAPSNVCSSKSWLDHSIDEKMFKILQKRKKDL